MTAVMWVAIVGVGAGGVTQVGLHVLIRRGISAAALLCIWGVMVGLIITALALPALAELLHRCWLTVHSADTSSVSTPAGALSVSILLVTAMRGGWRLGHIGRLRHRLHGRHFEMMWVLTRERPRRGAVLWLPATQPLAYSLAGQPPLVVATAGLREVFDDATVGAVLAHEHAHVARRHHLLVALADALASGLGWLPLMRQSPSLVRTLVELDADAHAARGHGPHRLLLALQALQHATAPPAALGITSECTQLRLARLAAEQRGGSGRFDGAAARCGAVLVVGVTALLGLGTVIGLVSCTAV
ncbi:M56 family metallopeptidase [Mycolicibacterium fortuitum]|uniref:M56 family metallopeptidase n=1 Tax=Mycolicibacterium TaxID=1866885 RepID=UPI000AD3711B|nr:MULTISPECIES: M56 family metallopeptidase [Mycolicibacterium]